MSAQNEGTRRALPLTSRVDWRLQRATIRPVIHASASGFRAIGNVIRVAVSAPVPVAAGAGANDRPRVYGKMNSGSYRGGALW